MLRSREDLFTNTNECKHKTNQRKEKKITEKSWTLLNPILVFLASRELCFVQAL